MLSASLDAYMYAEMASKLVLILHLVLIHSSLAAKVGIIPQFGRSHYMVFAKLAEELMNRGHQVSIYITATLRLALRCVSLQPGLEASRASYNIIERIN